MNYHENHDLRHLTASSEGDAEPLRHGLRIVTLAVVALTTLSSSVLASGPGASPAAFRDPGEVRRAVIASHHDLAQGDLLHDQGDLDAAERLYRQAADVTAGALPEDHPAGAYPRVAMGRLLLDRGEAAAAEGVLREALASLETTHAPGHWRIADAVSLLGGSLAAQGRYEEAEALMRPAYVALQEQLSARSPRTRRALARLADLYRSLEVNSTLIEPLLPPQGWTQSSTSPP